MSKRLKVIFSPYKGRKDELIPLLQAIQEELGYISYEAMVEIARFIRVSEARVYAVASFYRQFRFTPPGKRKVAVCRGTACHVRGAAKIIDQVKRQLDVEEGETTKDLNYTLETVACIGCCALAPCMTIDKEVKTKLTPKKVAGIFTKSDKKR